MSGFGLSSWGTTTFGFGSPFAPLSIVGAVAVNTHGVLVGLTAPPLASSPTGIEDALNPATWTVERLDTSETFTVVSVLQVTSVDYELVLLEPLASVLITHRVSAPGLLRADLSPIVPPTSADFLGLLAEAVASPAAIAASRRFALTDLANPPTQPGLNTISGTLIMTPGGDYKSVSGAELIRKLILRRLSTIIGEFFHLPNYGLGLRVKEPIPISDQVKLKTEIERQVALEPEVAAVAARVQFQPAQNILETLVSATLRTTGDRIDVPFQFPVGTLSL